jgi:hypothetical protein
VTAHPAELVTVQVRGFPLSLYARAQEHAEELMREFALLAMRPPADRPHAHAPRRLLALVEELQARYAGLSDDVNAVRDEALAAGAPEVDLTYQMPRGARDDVVRLGELLDEADEFCRAEQLLTLASPTEVTAFRRWFLGEFVRQLDGGEPVPWPAFLRPDTT